MKKINKSKGKATDIAADAIAKASAAPQHVPGSAPGNALQDVPATQEARQDPLKGSVWNAIERARTRGERIGLKDAMLVLCHEMAGGKSAASVFQEYGDVLPTRGKFEQWLGGSAPMQAQFEQAQRARAAYYVDQVQEIVETPPDRVETKFGSRVDPGHVAWQKLRADTHLRIAASLLPRLYGEHVTQDHTGDVHVQHSGTVALAPLDAFGSKLTKLASPALDVTPSSDP
jgi:hypothetical protein